MKQEIKDFEKRFDEALKEVLVLTEGGPSASRIGKNELWEASVTVLALVDVAAGELVEDKCYLTWQMTEKERQNSKKIFNLKGETIYHLKVRESLPFINQYTGMEIKKGNSLWVREVIKRNCHEDRLEAILAEYRKPVTLKLKGCEELTLDKSLGMFSGGITWNGEVCFVNLDVDEEGAQTAKDACNTLKKLMDNCKEWDEKARKYAAAELTENANEWAEDDDDDENVNEITEEEFAGRLIISEICVSTDGDFEIYYDDDDMFWGHVVIVSGNIKTGFDDANIAG